MHVPVVPGNLQLSDSLKCVVSGNFLYHIFWRYLLPLTRPTIELNYHVLRNEYRSIQRCSEQSFQTKKSGLLVDLCRAVAVSTWMETQWAFERPMCPFSESFEHFNAACRIWAMNVLRITQTNGSSDADNFETFWRFQVTVLSRSWLQSAQSTNQLVKECFRSQKHHQSGKAWFLCGLNGVSKNKQNLNVENFKAVDWRRALTFSENSSGSDQIKTHRTLFKC
jgi:hypothetical protein